MRRRNATELHLQPSRAYRGGFKGRKGRLHGKKARALYCTPEIVAA